MAQRFNHSVLSASRLPAADLLLCLVDKAHVPGADGRKSLFRLIGNPGEVRLAVGFVAQLLLGNAAPPVYNDGVPPITGVYWTPNCWAAA